MADIVTSAEAKSYLGVEHSDDDTIIGEIIGYVSAAVEKFTGRTFTQDGEEGRTEYLDGGVNELVIQAPPITSIIGIYDHNNADAEIDKDTYDFDAEAGLIWIKSTACISSLALYGGRWGTGRKRWKVVYVGGSDGAPDDVKLGALTWIADIYGSRDDPGSERLGDRQVTRAAGMPDRVREMLIKHKLLVI